MVDPTTGNIIIPAPPIDPNTGLPFDPNAAPPVDPNAPPIDPNTGLPFDPNAPPIDPNTGLPFDPNAPPPVDPNALPIDPNTGLPFDPNAAPPVDPNAIPSIDLTEKPILPYDNFTIYNVGDRIRMPDGSVYDMNNYIGAAGFAPKPEDSNFTQISPPTVPSNMATNSGVYTFESRDGKFAGTVATANDRQVIFPDSNVVYIGVSKEMDKSTDYCLPNIGAQIAGPNLDDDTRVVSVFQGAELNNYAYSYGLVLNKPIYSNGEPDFQNNFKGYTFGVDNCMGNFMYASNPSQTSNDIATNSGVFNFENENGKFASKSQTGNGYNQYGAPRAVLFPATNQAEIEIPKYKDLTTDYCIPLVGSRVASPYLNDGVTVVDVQDTGAADQYHDAKMITLSDRFYTNGDPNFNQPGYRYSLAFDNCDPNFMYASNPGANPNIPVVLPGPPIDSYATNSGEFNFLSENGKFSGTATTSNGFDGTGGPRAVLFPGSNTAELYYPIEMNYETNYCIPKVGSQVASPNLNSGTTVVGVSDGGSPDEYHFTKMIQLSDAIYPNGDPTFNTAGISYTFNFNDCDPAYMYVSNPYASNLPPPIIPGPGPGPIPLPPPPPEIAFGGTTPPKVLPKVKYPGLLTAFLDGVQLYTSPPPDCAPGLRKKAVPKGKVGSFKSKSKAGSTMAGSKVGSTKGAAKGKAGSAKGKSKGKAGSAKGKSKSKAGSAKGAAKGKAGSAKGKAKGKASSKKKGKKEKFTNINIEWISVKNKISIEKYII